MKKSCTERPPEKPPLTSDERGTSVMLMNHKYDSVYVTIIAFYISKTVQVMTLKMTHTVVRQVYIRFNWFQVKEYLSFLPVRKKKRTHLFCKNL